MDELQNAEKVVKAVLWIKTNLFQTVNHRSVDSLRPRHLFLVGLSRTLFNLSCSSRALLLEAERRDGGEREREIERGKGLEGGKGLQHSFSAWSAERGDKRAQRGWMATRTRQLIGFVVAGGSTCIG